MDIPIVKTGKFFTYNINITNSITAIESNNDKDNNNNIIDSKKGDLVNLIINKGEEIRVLKVHKPPTLKEDLIPLIQELILLKQQYKILTGEEYGVASTPSPSPPTISSNNKIIEEKKKDGPSKSELNKLKKKENKLAKRAEEKGNNVASTINNNETNQQIQQSSSSEQHQLEASETTSSAASLLYGDLPLIRSEYMTDKVYKQIKDLDVDLKGEKIWLRGQLSYEQSSISSLLMSLLLLLIYFCSNVIES
jgi:hypothetical protein